MNRLVLATAAASLAALSLAGCQKSGRRNQRLIDLQPCRVKGITSQTVCATVPVFEDSQSRRGRKIPLRVAVVKALAAAPAEDPLFLLAGGPGQGAVEAVGPLLPAFERVRRQRDIVLVDQRGTGASGPLECDLMSEDASLAERLSDEGLQPAAIRKCLAGYDADPRFYTTAHFVGDLDEVRAALGAEQINLWGASYGTRAALEYMRVHPTRVRTAVLDGVAPYTNRLPLHFARDGQRALDLLFQHCAADQACNRAYPELDRRFGELLSRLESTPAAVTVADPVSGAPAQVSIGREAFVAGLRGVLYLPDLAVLVPLMIDRAARGDYGPFVAATVGLQQGFASNMSIGLFLSVVCAEDVPFITAEDVTRESEGTFLGPGLGRQLTEACALWPRGAVPPERRTPVRSSVPTLLLSGELDPVTPPRWAEEAAKTLSQALHVVVPGVGHGATGQGCVPELVSGFVARASLDGVDTSCVSRLGRPPFFITFAGPTP